MRKVIAPGRKKSGRQGANKRVKLEMRRAQRRNLFRDLGRMGWRRFFWIVLALGLTGVAGYGVRRGLQAYRDGRILTINRIEVTGNHHWEASRLLESVDLEVGTKLPGVSMRSVRETLRRLPGIRSVSVRSSLNGELRVEVKEEDVLALRQSGGWEGLTPSGAWMPMREREIDLPVIDGEDGGNAAALARFMAGARAEYPRLFSAFSQVSVRGPDEADLYWRDGRFMARIDYRDKSLNSLEFLSALMKDEQASWPSGSTVDLRVEGYAYVQ